jgi:hypothetical protein
VTSQPTSASNIVLHILACQVLARTIQVWLDLEPKSEQNLTFIISNKFMQGSTSRYIGRTHALELVITSSKAEPSV